MTKRASEQPSREVSGLSDADLRRHLGQFVTGVTVITATSDKTQVGITANSFSSVSLKPPLIQWSISRRSRNFDAFTAAGSFAVNILGRDHITMAQHFASSAVNKFEGVNWRPGANGSPVLPDAICVLECRTEAMYDGGDHVIILGRIEHAREGSGDPLVFSRGRFATALEQISIDAGSRSDGQSAPSDPFLQSASLLVLVFHAFNALSTSFDRYRSAIGLSVAQSRVLTALSAKPGSTADTVSRNRELSLQVATDTLADLTGLGEVRKEPGDRFYLTERGQARRQQIAEQDELFNAEVASSFTAEEIESAREFLIGVIERNRPVETSAPTTA